VADAGSNGLSTFTLGDNGLLTSIDTVGTGESATCWVTGDNGYFYASNAGSGTLSTYRLGTGGELTLQPGTTATDPGTVDSATTPDGAFLYVQAGLNGDVDAFSVGSNGSLSEVGSVTVPGAAGGEGIVAI
jgi:6-phosphogluconolactonase (cycloisomerase 2 family)